MSRLIGMVLVCWVASQQGSAQSLADAARKETERRRQLAEQGVEARVIEGDSRAQSSRGSITTFTRGSEPKNLPARAGESGRRASASTYRSRLQKLDREIREEEERRDLLLRQAEAAKWSLQRIGRTRRAAAGPTLQERLRKQAEELEIKLKTLRQQRLETYEAGRKAGFNPGELDGKAVTP